MTTQREETTPANSHQRALQYHTDSMSGTYRHLPEVKGGEIFLEGKLIQLQGGEEREQLVKKRNDFVTRYCYWNT